MKAPLISGSSVLLITLALAGCGEGALDAPAPANNADPAATARGDLIDADNNHFVRVGLARTKVVERVAQPGRTEGVPLKAASAEELALALRPVRLYNGQEYALARPDLALATRALVGKQAESRSWASPASPPLSEAVIGTDERSYVSSNTSFPWSTFTFSEVGCSGTMIGPGTMITAAHCVYDTTSNAWLQVYDPKYNGGSRRWPRWSPGVDGRDSNSVPYGWNQCYDVTIPTGFVNEPNSDTATALLYDYAVIDFTSRCGARPGDRSGWLGTTVASDATISGSTVRIYGYPGSAGGASRYHGSVPNLSAELWGMSGSAGRTYVGSPSTELNYTIDTSPGQSGSSQWIISSDYYVIGIHHGASGSVNIGRRWDSNVYNFVSQYSPFPEQR